MKPPANLSRIMLIGAAGLALVAGALAIRRGQQDAPPPAPAIAEAAQPDIGQMIARLEARLKDRPNDPAGWRMLGLSFYETGRFAESATAYKRAAQLEPKSAETWSALGEALTMARKNGVPADAQAAFRTALSVDPKDPRARYFLAVAKDLSGNARGAIDDLMAVLKDSKADDPWVADITRIVTGIAQRDKIDIAGRLAAVSPAPPASGKASAAIPGPTRDQMQSASQLPPGQQQAMIDGMVQGLADKLKANPKNPDGWIMLMRSYVQLGRNRDAQAALESAKAANPDAASALDSAARELGL